MLKSCILCCNLPPGGLHGIVSDGGGMAKDRAAAGDHLSATFTAPPPLRPILKRVGASTSFLPSAANTSSQHSLCNTRCGCLDPAWKCD